MSGMLTQLAAATAIRGTKRPIMPWERLGFRAMKRLNPTAVATEAAVAATYACRFFHGRGRVSFVV